MLIRMICVGRLKEKYFTQAQAEYVKMLSRFAAVDIAEVRDERPKGDSPAAQRAAKEAEGARILAQVRGFVIACDPKGCTMTSEQFAKELEDLRLHGKSTVSFIIGGSTGLSDEVRRGADLVLSFSAMTMPHRLFRIVLLEQIYRAFKIASGEAYHK